MSGSQLVTALMVTVHRMNAMDMTDGSPDSGEILDDNLMPVEEDTEEAQ